MPQAFAENLVWPMFALATLTLSVGLIVGFRRVRAGARRQVRPDDFRDGESGNVPEDARIANRNYMNLLEAPVLFYVASLIAMVTHHERAILVLAWLYVALRLGHSIVHLAYNRVSHRALLFASSNVVLGTMWIRLVISLS